MDWQDGLFRPISSVARSSDESGLIYPQVQNSRSQRRRSSSKASSSHRLADTSHTMQTAMVRSSRQSSERERSKSDQVDGSDLTERGYSHRYDELSTSNLTELERQAESMVDATARHVTFRNTPSFKSMHDTWEVSHPKRQQSLSGHSRGEWEDGGQGGGAW